MINDTDTDTDDSEIDNEWVDEFKKKEEIIHFKLRIWKGLFSFRNSQCI